MENIFEVTAVIIFGAIFGSYATLFAYRLPRDESCFGRYFGKKSRCHNCGRTLITRELIPLINWFITFGKCRSCKSKVPRIHFFIEFSTTILFVICYFNFGISELFIVKSMIAIAMIIAIACDITHKKFTNQILNFLLIFIIIDRVLKEPTLLNIIYSSLVGVLASTIFYKLICKKYNNFFANETQIFDYIKFILIASVALDYQSFLYYYFEVLLILSLLLIFNIIGKRSIISVGYVFVLPLLWMLIIQPIN